MIRGDMIDHVHEQEHRMAQHANKSGVIDV